MLERNGRDLVVDLALGAVAGAAATWVMGLATSFLYEREDDEAREREDNARDGRTAYGVAAQKAAGLVGRRLDEETREKAGSALHYGLGAGMGAAYAGLRHHVPAANAAGGTLFGTAVWLLMDEAAAPVFGLTPGPAAFPWQTHARGLAGHLVYGTVTEGLLSAADRAL
jgi:Protein of unknown function (DUF1440)